MKRIKYISPKDQLILDILNEMQHQLTYGGIYHAEYDVDALLEELKDVMTEDRYECEMVTGTVRIEPKPLETTMESI